MKHLATYAHEWCFRGLFLLLLITGPATYAQVPAWQTAVGTAGTSITVRAAASDARGNIILIGNFANTATFGSIVLTSTGTDDAFVAKWSNSTSSFVWVQQVGGLGGENATAVAISGNSIYVGGTFSGRNAQIGNTYLTNADSFGNNDLFVAKLTDAGTTSTVAWAQRAGGQGNENFTGLGVNGASVYAVGNFFGSTTAFGNISLAHAGNLNGPPNVFIAKLTDAGSSSTFTWAQQAGGTVSDQANAVAVSGPNIYVAGTYIGNSTRFGSTTLPTAGNADLFVAKLIDAGSTSSFAWVQWAGGTGYDVAKAITVNASNLYLTGYFSSPTLTLGSSTLTNAGNNDLLVAKLIDAGSTGSFAWGQQAGGIDSEIGNAIATSGSNVYVTGNTDSPTATFGSTTVATAGQTDVFLAKLVDSGNSGSFAWTQQAGGTAYDFAEALVVGGTQVYVAGTFTSPTASFGSHVLTRPGPGYAFFLASLSDPTLTATTPALSGVAFTVDPNPARTAATVTLPAVPGTASATLTLRDAVGRAVRTTAVPLPVAGLRYELNLAGLAPGIYALRVQAGEATGTRRLVVE